MPPLPRYHLRMPAGKSHRPLFDLVNAPIDRQPRARAGSSSPVPPSFASRVEPKHPDTARPPIERYEATTEPEADHQPVRLSLSGVQIGVGVSVILLALFVTWAAGVKWGGSEVKKQLQAFSNEPTVPVREPSRDSSPEPLLGVGAGGQASPQPTAPVATDSQPKQVPSQPAAQPATQPATQPAQPTAAPAIAGLGSKDPRAVLTSKGWAFPDPREAGYNYLPLGIVFREEAVEVVPYFAQSGLEIIAVPWGVDSAGSGGNNVGPAKYRLFTLTGYPGALMSQSTDARTELLRRVGDVAARWKRDRRGASTLVPSGWEKYQTK